MERTSVEPEGTKECCKYPSRQRTSLLWEWTTGEPPEGCKCSKKWCWIMPNLLQSYNSFGTWYHVQIRHDGAPAHRLIKMRNFWRNLSVSNVSLYHLLEEPNRWTDLTLCEVFFWLRLKGQVCQSPFLILHGLRDKSKQQVNIRKENSETEKRAVPGVIRRFRVCLQRGRRWVKGQYPNDKKQMCY